MLHQNSTVHNEMPDRMIQATMFCDTGPSQQALDDCHYAKTSRGEKKHDENAKSCRAHKAPDSRSGKSSQAKTLKASEFWRPLTAMTMKPEHVESSEIEITSENWEGQGAALHCRAVATFWYVWTICIWDPNVVLPFLLVFKLIDSPPFSGWSFQPAWKILVKMGIFMNLP